MPAPVLEQSIYAHLSAYIGNIFLRQSFSLFPKTSTGLPSPQKIPQTQFQSYQPQNTSFHHQLWPKTATIKTLHF